MSKAQDSIDGYAVEMYAGRFSGTFDMEEAQGKQVAFDDVVTFVVVAEVASPSFRQNKAGEVKRTNSFKVTAAQIVNGNKAAEVLEKAGMEVLGITPPKEYHGSEAFIDPSTGDVYGADADPDQPWWDEEDDYVIPSADLEDVAEELPFTDFDDRQIEMTGTGSIATPGATSLGQVGQTKDASLRAFLEAGV